MRQMFFTIGLSVTKAVTALPTRFGICTSVIASTMLIYSEEKIMSYILAILQAAAQAVCEIFPFSFSGLLAVQRDFAGDFSGTVLPLAGVIHIAAAVGIVAAFFKMFRRETGEFFLSFADMAQKKFSLKFMPPTRGFMACTLISFLFFIALLIPAGDYGNLYEFFRYFSYDRCLLDEGLCYLITFGVMLACVKTADLRRREVRSIGVPFALVMGVLALVSANMAGFSMIVLLSCVAMLWGLADKLAVRYAFAIAAPVFLGRGIIELVQTPSAPSVGPAIVAFIVGAIVSFFAARFFLWVVCKRHLQYFVWYDLAFGGIVSVVGIVQLFVR